MISSLLRLRIDAGHRPWSWMLTVECDEKPIGAEVEGRRFEWADLELLTSGKHLDRAVRGGRVVIWKTGDSLSIKIVGSVIPRYALPSGCVGSVGWSDFVRALDEIELRRAP